MLEKKNSINQILKNQWKASPVEYTEQKKGKTMLRK
jgi:hypothetical protein